MVGAGGLVGDNKGSITASYATGETLGENGDDDLVGGLVGYNEGTIIATYSTGDADGGNGNDTVGGLVGENIDDGLIIASYATGTADGGVSGDNDRVGSLVGSNADSTRTPVDSTASYGFGRTVGVDTMGIDRSDDADSTVMNVTGITEANSGSVWNSAENSTMGAWNFGNTTERPVLLYADYDGAGDDYSCDDFPDMLPDGNSVTCGSTIIPMQGNRVPPPA